MMYLGIQAMVIGQAGGSQYGYFLTILKGIMKQMFACGIFVMN